MIANQSPPHKEDTSRKNLTVIVWIIIIFLSVPQIFLHESGWDLPEGPLGYSWIGWIRIVVLTGLWILSWVWPKVKPLGGFILAMLAFWVAAMFLEPLVFGQAAWSNWLEERSWGVWVVAYTIQSRLILVALMALTLIGSGIGLKELFLVKGNPKAPASPTRLLQGNKTIPWNLVIRGWLPWFVLILIAVIWFQIRPDLTQFSRALIFLPGIFIAAVINAFSEEFMFRSIMLARLEPVVGPQGAIWMAAGLFGLMHYFGDPGGVFGVLLAGYLGWLAAKSMIETRGFVWAMVVHTLGDFIIYIFWAMAA